jgi:hypothetical protein
MPPEKSPPAQELGRLRQLVKALESGSKIIRGGKDVTQDELRKVKLEIAYLEKTLPAEPATQPKPPTS